MLQSLLQSLCTEGQAVMRHRVMSPQLRVKNQFDVADFRPQFTRKLFAHSILVPFHATSTSIRHYNNDHYRVRPNHTFIPDMHLLCTDWPSLSSSHIFTSRLRQLLLLIIYYHHLHHKHVYSWSLSPSSSSSTHGSDPTTDNCQHQTDDGDDARLYINTITTCWCRDDILSIVISNIVHIIITSATALLLSRHLTCSLPVHTQHKDQTNGERM